MGNIQLRRGQPDDLQTLKQLFADTVSTICRADYDERQIRAWVSGVENEARWHQVMAEQYVLIAHIDEAIAGFATLDQGGYIDLLFVHEAHQRRGIASLLYGAIEKEAQQRGEVRLYAHVSITARSFFERYGFSVVREQKVTVQGVELTNYVMEKKVVL